MNNHEITKLKTERDQLKLKLEIAKRQLDKSESECNRLQRKVDSLLIGGKDAISARRKAAYEQKKREQLEAELEELKRETSVYTPAEVRELLAGIRDGEVGGVLEALRSKNDIISWDKLLMEIVKRM